VSVAMLAPGRPEMLATVGAASAAPIDNLLHHIKMAVFKGRVRLNDFFKDFDPLRSGLVCEAKFRSAMSNANFELTEPHIRALCSRYRRDPHGICYKDLLTDVEVFTTPNLEANPRADALDFTCQFAAETQNLSIEEEKACDRLLARLAHLVRVKQLLIRPVFADYQMNVNSPLQIDQVTKAQFRGGLSQLNLQVNSEEASLLCRKFAGSAEGYVDYISFVCAVDQSQRIFSSREPMRFPQPVIGGFREHKITPSVLTEYQPGRAPTSFSEPRLLGRSGPPTLSAVLKLLQDKAVQFRIRVGEFLVDFDKHCSGAVPATQFIKGLRMAYDKTQLELSESEITLLTDAYSTETTHGGHTVQWRKFVADVEVAFQASGMERDPASSPRNVLRQQLVVTLRPEAEGKVRQLLSDLRRRVDVRRILVHPLFHDYGSWSHSTKVVDHLTRQQTIQSLARFGIDLTADEASLLFERYNTLGTGTVNFVALVRDIDSLNKFSGRVVRNHALPQDPEYNETNMLRAGFRASRLVDGPIVNAQPGRPPTKNSQPARDLQHRSMPMLLSQLQSSISQQSVRTESHFKDYDRHHNGLITVAQFTSAVERTWAKHMPVSDSEMQMLVEKYRSAGSWESRVSWKSFVSDVDAAFNTDNLERYPLCEAPSHLQHHAHKLPVLSAIDEEAVQTLLTQLRWYCWTRRISVKPFLADCEFNRNSMRVVDHVTRAQFELCISRIGLPVNGAQMALLTSKFDDLHDGLVNYVLFAGAIDAQEAGSRRADGTPLDLLEQFKNNLNFRTHKVSDEQPGRAPSCNDSPSIDSSRAPDDINTLIERLQRKALQFNIPVQDFLKVYDAHHDGAITRSQFRRGLVNAFGNAYLKEGLKEGELQLLEEEFSRCMPDGCFHFDWLTFCGRMNEARLTVSAPKHPDGDMRVQNLLSAIVERIRIRSVYVKEPFQDFAKAKSSPLAVDHLTKQQFSQALNRIGIDLVQDDLELLSKKYDDHSDGTVNYVQFCYDVDGTEIYSNRHGATMGKEL